MVTTRRLLLSSLAVALVFVSVHAASAAELELAGIKLGRSAMGIIQKFGNPHEIRIGQQASVDQSAQAPQTPPNMGSMSNMPGMEGFGGSPDSSTPSAPPPTEMATKKGPPEVRWIYRFPKNRTIEFIINPDGRVMQIAAFGADWSTIRTSKGIALGTSTYKDVLAKYGFPESHDRAGIELITRYTGKHRVIFTLVGQTVVGITVGLMD